MRIVDSHVHVNGTFNPGDLLKCMDRNKVERTILISKSERVSLPETQNNVRALGKIIKQSGGRLGGLAWLNPTIPGTADLAREALDDLGYCGIKIIPDHWYAYESRLEPFWAALDKLKASVLFHTGTLWCFEDASRFCHPEYLEKLVSYPNIRFAMAHISWPWCEECLAVMGRMHCAVGFKNEGWQSYIDLTPGTPKHIRKQAIENAISFCGVSRLLFGSDDSAGPGKDLSHQAKNLKDDLETFAELGLSSADQERIFSGTADELFPDRT